MQANYKYLCNSIVGLYNSTKRPSKLQLLKIIGKTKLVTYRFYFFVGKLPQFFNLLESMRKSYLVVGTTIMYAPI